MINYIAIICFALWLMSLVVLNKGKMTFLKFLIGTVGGFVFMLYFGKTYLNSFVTDLNLLIFEFITVGSRVIDVFKESSAVTVRVGSDVLSYFVTFECSGLIEMMVFTNVLMFYPIYQKQPLKKILWLFAGNAYIIFANVLRLLLMTYVVVFWGIEWFFVSHVVIARMFFMLMNIVLYYIVFTLSHIKEQKAGTFTFVKG